MIEAKTGDFLILGFGRGTQGVKVIGGTAKRLEIVRCESYLTNPRWLVSPTMISRTDSRIQSVWNISPRLAEKAPTADEIAAEKIKKSRRAAKTKAGHAAEKPLEVLARRIGDEIRNAQGTIECRHPRYQEWTDARAAGYAARRAGEEAFDAANPI